MKEIWKDIKGYEGLYQVSNLGNVMSWVNNSQHKRTRGLILKPRISKHGYYYINIYKDGKRKTVKNHRLVATHFISNPKNLPCVNHRDGNKLNNKVSNLEWVTYSENRNHAINTGLVDMNNSSLFKSGENNIMFGAKSPRRRRIVQLDLDGNFIREWDCIADAQTTYNTAHISAVCRGKRHHDKGFIWKYTEDYYGIKPEKKTRKKKEV